MDTIEEMTNIIKRSMKDYKTIKRDIRNKNIKDLDTIEEFEMFESIMFFEHNLLGFMIDYTVVNENIECIQAGKSRIIQKQQQFIYSGLDDKVYKDKDNFYKEYFSDNILTIYPDRENETLEEYANRCATEIKKVRNNYKKHDHLIDTYNETLKYGEKYLKKTIDEIENNKCLSIDKINYILFPIISCEDCLDKLCLQLNLRISPEIKAEDFFDYGQLNFPIIMELNKPKQVIEEIDKILPVIVNYSKAYNVTAEIDNKLFVERQKSFEENILKHR